MTDETAHVAAAIKAASGATEAGRAATELAKAAARFGAQGGRCLMLLVYISLKYRLYYPAAQCAQRKVFVGGVILNFARIWSFMSVDS